MSADHTLDSKAEEGGITTQHTAVSSSSSLTDREAFLSSFSAEEDKKIMRKVDKRFLLLIGLMYVLKNVDYINAATVKVLQVNQPRNVLIELNMTADQYNWVQSIYFVSSCLGVTGAKAFVMLWKITNRCSRSPTLCLKYPRISC